MPRVIEERWIGIGFDVITEHTPVADERGNVIHDAHGLPKTQEMTTLVFVIPLPDGQHIVRVPFTADGKRQLLEKLTGGIVIANGVQPHI